jgi:hypothetical protein
VRFAGAHIAEPAFGDDDGSCPPVIAAALAAHAVRPDKHAVAAALLGQRLLVPVVAMLESTEEVSGHQVEKESAMATVTIRSARGAAALPVFTSTESLAAWDPHARPVAVLAQAAAAAALAEEADVILLDPAGPVRVMLPGAAVAALAENRVWQPPWRDEQVAAAVGEQAVAAGLGSGGIRLSGAGDDLVIEVELPADADPSGIAEQLSGALAADERILGRLTAGVQLRLVSAGDA